MATFGCACARRSFRGVPAPAPAYTPQRRVMPRLPAELLHRVSSWSGRGVLKSALAAMRVELEVPRAQAGVAVTFERYNEVSGGSCAIGAIGAMRVERGGRSGVMGR